MQTGSTWIPFHPRNMLHLCHKAPRHLAKQYCREGKSVFWLDWIVQCFTSPPTQYRLYGRQCSGYLYCSRPWIHTFWAHCSSRWCWLALSGNLVTHGRCCNVNHKAFWHLENHEWQSQFWPFLLDQTMTIHTFGARYSVLLNDSNWLEWL